MYLAGVARLGPLDVGILLRLSSIVKKKKDLTDLRLPGLAVDHLNLSKFAFDDVFTVFTVRTPLTGLRTGAAAAVILVQALTDS